MEMELNGLLPFHSLISSMVSGCWLCLLGPSNSSPFPLPFLFYCVAKQKKIWLALELKAQMKENEQGRRNEGKFWLSGMKFGRGRGASGP